MSSTRPVRDAAGEVRDAARRLLAAGDAARTIELLEGRAADDEGGESLALLGVFDTFQIPYSCLAPEHYGWITRAAETGAGIIIRGGIADGGPEAEIQRPALNDIWTQAKLDEVLPEGMKRAELILRNTLSHPHCHTTIVGTCNPEHLAENLTAAARGPLPVELSDEIRSRIAALAVGVSN